MAQAELKQLSLVDSTHRIRWEVTKQEFDNCQFPNKIKSPVHTIHINGEESTWYLQMCPKGEVDKEKDNVRLYLIRGDSLDKKYNVRYQFGIETPSGCWPHAFHDGVCPRMDSIMEWLHGDFVKKVYLKEKFEDDIVTFSKHGDKNSEHYNAWGDKFCTTEDLSEQFVEDKVIVVATLVVYAEGDGYRDYMDMADDFVGDIRSASSLVSLSDFKITCGKKNFRCHKVILASRSEYFKTLFRNEPKKKVLRVDESPDLVRAMLRFINKGVIPSNIGEVAMDLIIMSDFYGLSRLTVACEKSLVRNLSVDNALETLIIIDKINHVSKLTNRQKVLDYIKKEATQIVKTDDWKKFIKNYADLVTEIVLLNDSV